MKVCVTETVTVDVIPGLRRTYQPGTYTATRGEIAEIERQGKGRRLKPGKDEAPEHGAVEATAAQEP